MRKLKAVYILARDSFGMIYGPDEQRDIAALVDVLGRPLTRDDLPHAAELLAQADVLFSGWGAPTVDERLLDACPRLAVIFYGAGAAGHVATPATWERGIVVTSAYAANAVPVAEYALATILFSLKHGWRLARETRRQRQFPARDGAPGCYGRTVGLVSLGTIARALLDLLRPFDLRILVHDPFLTSEEAGQLGVERVSLDDVFERSDVVSVHTPLLDETHGLITGRHIASMRRGATFINTARGEIVAEAEMIDVLSRRPDLQAVLDVAEGEPPEPTSSLYDLPNVVLTPHIAGSVGAECRRMGRYMVEELKRYVAGQPLRWTITPELAARSSHRPSALRAKAHPGPNGVAVVTSKSSSCLSGLSGHMSFTSASAD